VTCRLRAKAMVNTPFAPVIFIQHMGTLAMQAASQALHVKE
jgi:hypothetical protein